MKIKKLILALSFILIVLFLSIPTLAEEKLNLEKTAKSIDFVWTLVAAFLVFLITLHYYTLSAYLLELRKDFLIHFDCEENISARIPTPLLFLS